MPQAALSPAHFGWRLLAHLGGPEIADDLTQETYLRVIGALPRFAARSSARTWLLSLAKTNKPVKI